MRSETRVRTEPPRPVLLPEATAISQICGGEGMGLALTTSELVLAWGDNTWGQLGNNGASAVAAGQYHSLAR